MKKKRLVYILHEIKVGGVEVALISAIPALHQRFELKIVVLGLIDENLIAHLNEQEKAAFKCFDFSLALYPLKISSIADYIVAFNPDYLISSLWRASWVATLVHRRKPSIHYFSFIHSSVFFHRLDRFFTRRAIGSADAVLVDSGAAARFVLGQGNCKVPVRIISLLTFSTPHENRVLNRRASLPNMQHRFLFMGRINKVKNLTYTIAFIRELIQGGADVSLDIYGRPDDDYENALNLVKEWNLNSRILFKGEVLPSQRFELFPQYDYFIQLSSVEGMAMSVAEAMQNGLVCVVTPVGEIPNYSKDKISALFVELDDKSMENPVIVNKVLDVMKNEAAYNRISETCHKNFTGSKTYAASLIENIEAL